MKLGQLERDSTPGFNRETGLSAPWVNQSLAAELSESYHLLPFPFCLLTVTYKHVMMREVSFHLEQCGLGRVQLGVALHLWR